MFLCSKHTRCKDYFWHILLDSPYSATDFVVSESKIFFLQKLDIFFCFVYLLSERIRHICLKAEFRVINLSR